LSIFHIDSISDLERCPPDGLTFLELVRQINNRSI